MSTFKLTQTGTEMQADLDKVEGMANIKTVGSGLTLSAAGELSSSGGGGSQLYLHTIALFLDGFYTVTGYIVSNSSTAFQGLATIFRHHGPFTEDAISIGSEIQQTVYSSAIITPDKPNSVMVYGLKLGSFANQTAHCSFTDTVTAI